MTLRPPSEAFIRRSWYSVLPVLGMTGRCRVKKAVVDKLIGWLCFDELLMIVFQPNESVHREIRFVAQNIGVVHRTTVK